VDMFPHTGKVEVSALLQRNTMGLTITDSMV